MFKREDSKEKKIGFPTCNIDIKDYVIAMPGVYAVKVKQKNSNKSLKAIANLGYRPTFNQKKILLEVHIFNFSGNLYNKYLSVEFTKFIRKEKKFKNVDQLKKQIQSDLKVAKKS
ncbi:riboflavin kinase [Candidatus Pelagibacter ubique]|nr:riboflavin kinase [Candidatus Pelagibacter ubique]